MADVQKENGFVQIANEILDNIVKLNLNGTQFRIIMTVWRYTYGFNRKEHSISETFLSKAIDADRRNIRRELKMLFDMKILIKVKEATYSEPAIIKFNKNYDEYDGVGVNSPPEGELDLRGRKCPKGGGESAPSTGGEFAPQEIQLKYNKDNNAHSLFFETIWELYPRKMGKSKVSDKTKKELAKVGYDVISKAIENYKNQKPQYAEFMYGSTFFNKGYQDYVSDSVEDEPAKEQTKIWE